MQRLYKIVNLSRPVIYLAITIGILIPRIRPIGIPIAISDTTRSYYNFINGLKPGDILWLDSHFALPAAVECVPQMNATAYHAHSRGVKILLTAMSAEGKPFAENTLQALLQQGAKYGEDVVYLGFLAGEEATISSMLRDLHKTVPNDYLGKPLSAYPLTARIKSGSEIRAAASVTSSSDTPDIWTRQIKPFPNLAFLNLSNSTNWPKVQPYIATGQIKAGLNGSRGAAEYELLLNRKGQAVSSMDATSIAYLVFIGYIICGNLAHYLKPKDVAGQRGK